MRKLVLLCCTPLLLLHSVQAQTLFTYGSNPVTKQEFLKNYQKNEQNQETDFSEKALREYLDLYALFRMRVTEAELQQIDTIPAIMYELDNYKKQLAKGYLIDQQLTEKLTREAYERMKEEYHVAHILLMAPPGTNPADTLKLYQRMDSIYQAVTKNKASFAAMAAKYSDDAGTKDNGGELGYMTALQTVYPFENAVYQTKPGHVSKPFRSSLGFHIVQVKDKRPARGEIEVAQILIAAPPSKGEAGKAEAKRRAEEVIAAYKKGVSFDTLVAKYSEDKHSMGNAGQMERFGVGSMVQSFEDAAFSLKKPGDVSSPVETEYGYHVIRLIQKYPLKPYDSIQKGLARKIENDPRSQIAKDQHNETIKKKYNFREYPENLKAIDDRIQSIPDTGAQAHLLSAVSFEGLNQPLFTIGGNTYGQQDFIQFLQMVTRGKLTTPKKHVVKEVYKLYSSRVLTDFQETKLMEENAEFRNLMNEYRDGIMLFELMDRNIWGKATKDSSGLAQFYEGSKSRYQWEPGFSGSLYRFKNQDALKEGLAVLQKKKDIGNDDLLEELNTESHPDALSIQTGRYEFSRFREASRETLTEGTTTAPVQNTDGSYTVIRVEKVYQEPGQKSLDDARGYVVSEYQDYLEKSWNDTLRKKYSVTVDEKVFKTMVRK